MRIKDLKANKFLFLFLHAAIFSAPLFAGDDDEAEVGQYAITKRVESNVRNVHFLDLFLALIQNSPEKRPQLTELDPRWRIGTILAEYLQGDAFSGPQNPSELGRFVFDSIQSNGKATGQPRITGLNLIFRDALGADYSLLHQNVAVRLGSSGIFFSSPSESFRLSLRKLPVLAEERVFLFGSACEFHSNGGALFETNPFIARHFRAFRELIDLLQKRENNLKHAIETHHGTVVLSTKHINRVKMWQNQASTWDGLNGLFPNLYNAYLSYELLFDHYLRYQEDIIDPNTPDWIFDAYRSIADQVYDILLMLYPYASQFRAHLGLGLELPTRLILTRETAVETGAAASAKSKSPKKKKKKGTAAEAAVVAVNADAPVVAPIASAQDKLAAVGIPSGAVAGAAVGPKASPVPTNRDYKTLVSAAKNTPILVIEAIPEGDANRVWERVLGGKEKDSLMIMFGLAKKDRTWRQDYHFYFDKDDVLRLARGIENDLALTKVHFDTSLEKAVDALITHKGHGPEGGKLDGNVIEKVRTVFALRGVKPPEFRPQTDMDFDAQDKYLARLARQKIRSLARG